MSGLTPVHCNLSVATLQLAIQVILQHLKELYDAQAHIDATVDHVQAQLRIHAQGLPGLVDQTRQTLHLRKSGITPCQQMIVPDIPTSQHSNLQHVMPKKGLTLQFFIVTTNLHFELLLALP
jgi:hypothetical protein